ncbi:MAG: amidohydrolase [Anaerolineae bacterium]|nr:amidohydrolase [Anaerolineae bacterium]
MPQVDFRKEAESLFDEMVERRRDFHRHPELGFEEIRTAGIVAEELHNLGFEVQRGVGETGVVAMLDGPHEGPTVMLPSAVVSAGSCSMVLKCFLLAPPNVHIDDRILARLIPFGWMV